MTFLLSPESKLLPTHFETSNLISSNHIIVSKRQRDDLIVYLIGICPCLSHHPRELAHPDGTHFSFFLCTSLVLFVSIWLDITCVSSSRACTPPMAPIFHFFYVLLWSCLCRFGSISRASPPPELAPPPMAPLFYFFCVHIW